MQAARHEIAQAIALNPDAHFGREPVQLAVMDWIVHSAQSAPPAHLFERLPKADALALSRGLTGLIALGNAWESVDVFEALARTLERQGRYVTGYLAKQRARELIAQGHGSLLPGAPSPAADPRGLEKTLRLVPISLPAENARIIEQTYPALRREAEAWQGRRTAYLMARLRAGRHPDTDPAFWNDFRDAGPPSLALSWLEQVRWNLQDPHFVSHLAANAFLAAAGLLPVALLARYLRARRRRRRRHAGATNTTPAG